MKRKVTEAVELSKHDVETIIRESLGVDITDDFSISFWQDGTSLNLTHVEVKTYTEVSDEE